MAQMPLDVVRQTQDILVLDLVLFLQLGVGAGQAVLLSLELFGDVGGHVDHQKQRAGEDEQRPGDKGQAAVEPVVGEARQRVMRQHALVLQQGHPAEQEDGQGRLEITLEPGPHDAGQDHVEDEEEREGVLDAAGEMQDGGEDQQVAAHLKRQDGPDPGHGQLAIAGGRVLEEIPEYEIVDDQDGRDDVQRPRGQNDPHDAAGNESRHGQRADGHPSQPHEPLRSLDETRGLEQVFHPVGTTSKDSRSSR